jgi:hypothetical protein
MPALAPRQLFAFAARLSGLRAEASARHVPRLVVAAEADDDNGPVIDAGDVLYSQRPSLQDELESAPVAQQDTH